MPRHTIKSITALLIPFVFVIFWSLGAIFIKVGLTYTNPFTLLFYRFAIASIALILLAAITRSPWPNTGVVWAKIIAIGLLLQFFYTATFAYAIFYNVSPAVMTIILGLQPLLTAALLGFVLRKPVTPYQWLGLLLGLIGVILVVCKDLSSGDMTKVGFLIAVISLISITVGSLLQKNICNQNLITTSAIQIGISIIPTAILVACFGSFKIPLAPMLIASILWLGLLVSVGATCIYFVMIKNKHIINTTSLFYLVPVVTAVASYFVFDEKVTLYTWLSIVLVVAGMLIAKKT